MTSEYETESRKAFDDILNMILDAPTGTILVSEIRNMFNLGESEKDEKFAMRVLDYYNGRLALYERIKSDLDDVQIGSDQNSEPVVLTYDLPASYSSLDNSEQCISDVLTITISSY